MKERKQMTATNDPRGNPTSTRSGENAPNKPDDITKNIGGKTEDNKNEGGTKSEEEEKKAEDQRTRERNIARLGPDRTGSISQEESDKLEEGNFNKESKEGDRTILTSSISEEEAGKTLVSTEPVNFTQHLTGVPGNVDLTQGGRLSGDKSYRVKREIDDINEELEKTSGPNPAPNREGNELTKAINRPYACNCNCNKCRRYCR